MICAFLVNGYKKMRIEKGMGIKYLSWVLRLHNKLSMNFPPSPWFRHTYGTGHPNGLRRNVSLGLLVLNAPIYSSLDYDSILCPK